MSFINSGIFSIGKGFFLRDIELDRDRNSSSRRNETTIDMLWRVRPSIRPPQADYSGTGRCICS